MQTITTIGLDIAKSVFQVHGVDAAGEMVIRRQLKRRSVLAFFQSCRRVWSTLRRAHCRTWPYRATDAAGLREAIRQVLEERCS